MKEDGRIVEPQPVAEPKRPMYRTDKASTTTPSRSASTWPVQACRRNGLLRLHFSVHHRRKVLRHLFVALHPSSLDDPPLDRIPRFDTRVPNSAQQRSRTLLDGLSSQ